MERLDSLVCLALICVASVVSLDPRGARPVEQGTRDNKCDTQREWPFCTSDDWGPKCPSGCRIEGLMNKYDHSLLKKIEKIRHLLDQNRLKYRTTEQVSKQTYDYLREKLVIDAGSDENYLDLAQSLRKRITDMKIKIDKQLTVLAALKDQVKDQVNDMQRLEVDIDIKIRSCRGSCESYSEYHVDMESYVELDKQTNQLDSHSAPSIESVGTLYVMTSKPLKQAGETIFKSKAVGAQHTEDMFPEVGTNHLILEEEGTETSPATISKLPACARLQQNQNGRQPSRHTSTYCGKRTDATLCSDEDWVSKCPSGCRLHGLITQMASDAERKLMAACKAAKMYEDVAEKSMAAMTHIYGYSQWIIVNRYMSELRFVEHAEGLARNLTSLRKRSSRLSRQLDELRRSVRKQVEDLYRMEVDIDVKLRACRGSCELALAFGVDHRGYGTLEADTDRTEKTLSHRWREAPPPEDVPHVKLKPVDGGPAPSADYKSIPAVRRELLTQFEDVGQNRVVLDESAGTK